MSNRVTQKYLRSLERDGLATNINQWDEAQLNEIRHKGVATVSVSVGKRWLIRIPKIIVKNMNCS